MIFGAEIWVCNPLHGPGPGGVPVTGGAIVGREAPAEMDWRKMGMQLGGGSKRGVRI